MDNSHDIEGAALLGANAPEKFEVANNSIIHDMSDLNLIKTPEKFKYSSYENYLNCWSSNRTLSRGRGRGRAAEQPIANSRYYERQLNIGKRAIGRGYARSIDNTDSEPCAPHNDFHER